MCHGRFYFTDRVSENTLDEVMKKSARRVVITAAAVIVLPLTLFIGWEAWRAHTLLAFCRDVRVGMSFADLLVLEKRRWIDDSYLIQTRFDGYVDQAHSPDLEFRSHMMDPDFACAIGHNGHSVKTVQLLTLEGLDLKL